MKTLSAYINEMNNIKDMIIDYIDDDASLPKFDKLNPVDYNYPRKLILIEIFHLIENIANNHFRCPNFFVKIESLIHYFAEELKAIFSPNEIFKIFSSNKRILLFLIQEKNFERKKEIRRKRQLIFAQLLYFEYKQRRKIL